MALAGLPAASIDAVITDPPYGVTSNPWDRAPDLARWWPAVMAALKEAGTACVFAQQPFTTDLIVANRKAWRYELVWHKPRPTGFLNARRMPLRAHEHIQVFCRRPGPSVYHPQMVPGRPYKTKSRTGGSNYRQARLTASVNHGTRHPRSVLEFANPQTKGGHPTQKPLALLEWLVKTYTDPGQVVLDPYFGSGTTALACLLHGRRFLGFELHAGYFGMAVERLTRHSETRTDAPGI